MAELEPLIFDRTQTDVDNKTAKAFYNVKDLQRIQSYIDYLAKECSIILPTKSWVRGECCEYWKFQYYILNNIIKLKKYYILLKNAPQIPTISIWNYQKANDLEKILYDMYNSQPIISKSFAEDSWETINLISTSGYAKYYYNIGDIKNIITKSGKSLLLKLHFFDKNKTPNIVIGLEKPTEETYNVATFSHSQEDVNLTWENSLIRTTVLVNIFNDLPDDLMRFIKSTQLSSQHITGTYNQSSTEKKEKILTTDKLWVPSLLDEFSNYGSSEDIWLRDTKKLSTPNGSYEYVYYNAKNRYESAYGNKIIYDFPYSLAPIKWFFCI